MDTADTDTTDTAATLRESITPRRLNRLESIAKQRTRDLTVVLDGVSNQQNVSAITRSADAFGIMTIHLVSDAFSSTPGISLGSERWVDVVTYQKREDAIAALKKAGFSIVVLETDDKLTGGRGSIPVVELPFKQKLAMVFGNEGKGVSPLFRENADYFAHIPMFGFVESLNVSVACAICLFCSTTSGGKSTRQVPALGQQQSKDLFLEWLKKDRSRQ